MQIKCHDHRSRGSGDIRPDKHQANNFTIFPLHYAKLIMIIVMLLVASLRKVRHQYLEIVGQSIFQAGETPSRLSY